MRTQNRNIFIALGMFGLLALWLLFSLGGAFSKTLDTLRTILPTWFIAPNLLLAPCLLGSVGLRTWPIPLWLRLVLVALGLCSYSIASLIYREHPLAFMAMLAALFLEAFWIVPKWNTRYRRKGSDTA